MNPYLQDGCLPTDIDPPERDEDAERDEADDADFRNELAKFDE